MVRIAELIKQHAGHDKKIIFTLSPVPLNATFTKQPTLKIIPLDMLIMIL